MAEKSNNLVLMITVPIVVLACSIVIAKWMVSNPVEPKRSKEKPNFSIAVSTKVVQPQSYQVTIEAFGVVQAAVSGSLVAQVGGIVTSTSSEFEVGSSFKRDQTLLTLDDRDYQSALVLAQADVANAELSLQETQSQAEQARLNWQRIQSAQSATPGRTPSPLVLMIPQIKAAKARLQAAKATVSQRQLDLERTVIKAPYDGRIIKNNVDVGQYVNAGTVLADIYGSQTLEVKLPLSEKELQWVNVSASHEDVTQIDAQHQSMDGDLPLQPGEVTFFASYGGVNHEWQGRITHTSSTVNTEDRQLDVIAVIDDPYAENAERKKPLKIGQFLEARIAAENLNNVFVLPRSAVYEDRFVMVVVDGRLAQRALDIIWQDHQYFIASDQSSLKPGDKLVITPLGQPTSGTAVKEKEKGKPVLDKKSDPSEPSNHRPGRTLSFLSSDNILIQEVI